MNSKRSSAEIIFRRELSLLPSDEDRARRISDRFLIYTHNTEEIDINEADQALLWLVSVVKETFLAKKCTDSDKLWDLNIYLRGIYHALSLQNEHKFIFPETKKEILRIIMEQWDVQKCDKCGQEVFSFIWGRYDFNNPLEERKIIDILFKERLNGAKPEDVEKWMKWIAATISRRSGETKAPMFIQEYLARHLIIARARGSNFNVAIRDIRNYEIVKSLNLECVTDYMIPALNYVCAENIGLLRNISCRLERLKKVLLQSYGAEMSYEISRIDHVDISIIKEKPLWKKAVDKEEYFQSFFEKVMNKMKEVALLLPEKTISVHPTIGREISLNLSICNKDGYWFLKKGWGKKN